MLKKIALAGIFAVVSLVSVGSSTSKAADHRVDRIDVHAPALHGFCPFTGGRCV